MDRRTDRECQQDGDKRGRREGKEREPKQQRAVAAQVTEIMAQRAQTDELVEEVRACRCRRSVGQSDIQSVSSNTDNHSGSQSVCEPVGQSVSQPAIAYQVSAVGRRGTSVLRVLHSRHDMVRRDCTLRTVSCM